MMQQLICAAATMNNNVRTMFASPCGGNKVNRVGETDINHLATLCICQVVTPVIRFCQFFGVFPVEFHDSSTRRSDDQLFKFCEEDSKCRGHFKNWRIGERPASITKTRKECHIISSRWFSLPSFTNILLIFSSAGITAWTFSNLKNILTVYFEGTDLYTFGTQTICLYTQSNLILINAFLHRDRFCEIWALLLKVLKRLNQTQSNLEKRDTKLSVADGNNVKPTLCAHSENVGAATLRNFVVASALLHHFEYKCSPSDNPDSTTKETNGSKPPINPLPIEDSDVYYPGRKGEMLQKRLKVLRIFSYVCIVTILISSISHIVSFFNLVFYACFDKAADPGAGGVYGKPTCPFNNYMLFLQKCFYGLIDFVKQGVAVLFGTLCLIIYVFFRELEEQLGRVLKSFEEINQPAVSVQRHSQVEHLRLCYEDLTRLCRLMSHCFGLAIISVLITSVVSITCALYSIALSAAIETNETMQMARFYVIWAFHGWFGCFCLLLVLMPGQLITNASEAPSRVIGRHSLVHLDKETKYQLSQFQHQSRQPVVITACNIANVGLSFISAAATNVTTYMLVILQFRLGVENKIDHN